MNYRRLRTYLFSCNCNHLIFDYAKKTEIKIPRPLGKGEDGSVCSYYFFKGGMLPFFSLLQDFRAETIQVGWLEKAFPWARFLLLSTVNRTVPFLVATDAWYEIYLCVPKHKGLFLHTGMKCKIILFIRHYCTLDIAFVF